MMSIIMSIMLMLMMTFFVTVTHGFGVTSSTRMSSMNGARSMTMMPIGIYILINNTHTHTYIHR